MFVRSLLRVAVLMVVGSLCTTPAMAGRLIDFSAGQQFNLDTPSVTVEGVIVDSFYKGVPIPLPGPGVNPVDFWNSIATNPWYSTTFLVPLDPDQ